MSEPIYHRTLRWYSSERVSGQRHAFDVDLTSTDAGYSVRVTEITPREIREPVTLPGVPRDAQIHAPTFYRSRLHFRGELIGCVKSELEHNAVRRVRGLPDVPSIAAFDCHLRADLDSPKWPDGFPKVVRDDLADLDDLSLWSEPTA
ncbi:hypothetical protein P0D72_40155 [Paraburkholderia sediminicola]|uniref:hypothetical protein n=1 Tax=Paraburkholderia sediminicola TaxID=458836 RepID=UPI0038B95B1D